MRVKDWHKFQHFKDRKPPWIKLYRDLLDDMDWHELDAEACKVLVMLWLIASEDDGNLPSAANLAFRLRMREEKLLAIINKLGHWIQTDIIAISLRYQSDIPETETETETDIRALAQEFYSAYPNKKGPKDSEKAYYRAAKEDTHENIMAGLKRYCLSVANTEKRYIAHPSTWLNKGRWRDEADTPAKKKAPSLC